MLEVGFGSGVITPELPVVLAGFGARKGPATGIHDDLTAQAVVIRTSAGTACLLVLDLLLLGADVAGPLRAAVARELGTTTDRVMTSCTHTHAGPAATDTVRRIGWPMPTGYQDLLIDGCLTAVRTARDACRPATLSYARAALPTGLSLNRRGLPYDPTFAVLDVHGDDCRLGTIANVGIHPVALGVTCREVSGDWVASFRDAAAKETGAPSVLLPGALGDVNPTRDPHTAPDEGGNWETARLLGTEVADCATQLLTSTEPLPQTVELTARTVPIRAGLTIPAVLARTALRTVDVELLEWSLGGVRLTSVPGEAFHALGRAIEQARDGKALLAGLAPAYHGYLPLPFGKGYEEKMSYGRRFVRRLTEELT